MPTPPFLPYSMRRLLGSSVMIGVALLVLACSRDSASNHPIVEWPELAQLEQLLVQAELHGAGGRTGDVLLLRNEILESGWALDHRSVPTEVKDFDRVQLLLSDLVSKINGLAVPSINQEKLDGLIQGMRPIMAELIEVSGASVLPED